MAYAVNNAYRLDKQVAILDEIPALQDEKPQKDVSVISDSFIMNHMEHPKATQFFTNSIVTPLTSSVTPAIFDTSMQDKGNFDMELAMLMEKNQTLEEQIQSLLLDNSQLQHDVLKFSKM